MSISFDLPITPDAQESEALLQLSQHASRAQVRRWIADAGSASGALARHGKPPLWTRARLVQQGLLPITWRDANYPSLLRTIADPPLVLYAAGRIDAAEPIASVALVGARSGTPQGLLHARRMGRALADQGVRVLSGLARGIDSAAHLGVLESASPGAAWAVLGGGFQRLYPSENRRLVARILAADGLVLSEYTPDTPAARYRFPERNRIISGLVQAVVVVQASRRSGSLITARLAAEQGREVLAMPGPAGSAVSAGCHWLIRQGAGLVESAEDVLAELGIVAGPEPASKPPPETLRPVWQAVAEAPTAPEAIAIESGLAADTVAGHLVQLELMGFVQQTADGYIRTLP